MANSCSYFLVFDFFDEATLIVRLSHTEKKLKLNFAFVDLFCENRWRKYFISKSDSNHFLCECDNLINDMSDIKLVIYVPERGKCNNCPRAGYWLNICIMGCS